MNVATLHVRAFCRSVLEDPAYRACVLARARAGTLGQMEGVLYAYAYGKPKDVVELRLGSQEADLSSMTTDQLNDRAEHLVRQLHEARALSAPVIDVEAISRRTDETDC